MFSSNQILQVSGSLDEEQIRNALEYAIKLYSLPSPPTGTFGWQISRGGKYCIGWSNIGPAWKDYPFCFDTTIVARIILQWLQKQDVTISGQADGAYEKGFLMQAVNADFDYDTPIQDSFYGIVSFEPFVNFYAK